MVDEDEVGIEKKFDIVCRDLQSIKCVGKPILFAKLENQPNHAVEVTFR